MSLMSAAPFDPLDLRNYSLEKFKDIKPGRIMESLKVYGFPIAVVLFFFFHLRLCGSIELFDAQKVPQLCYSALGIFVASLILWLTETIPNFLTSFIVIVAAVVTGSMKMRAAFAMLGEPVMVLNIASFILASALVATGLAKRVSLYLVLRMRGDINKLFWSFILLNVLFGAFISATSAKTALLLPLFMVISAMYGATGGDNRNNVGRNMVLQNLLANNVSASAFMTGSAANLVAVALLEKAGAPVSYQQWLFALLPLCLIQCTIAWWTGTRLIFPIAGQQATPNLEGGFKRLEDEYRQLGKLSIDEIKAGVVFIGVLLLWATGDLHPIKAEVVALAGACVVFMPKVMNLPRIGVIKWNDADIPWHMLMFSWGAYVLGGVVEKSDIVGLWIHRTLDTWQVDGNAPGMKLVVFAVLSGLFGITTLISESKTARTIIMFPIMISVAKKFGWDVVGFCLPMAFMINQVYVLYFNSKPANISYLTDHYSNGESFKFGMIQMVLIWILLILWAQYVMPLMGFNSRLW
jgi:anion transporter